MCEADPRSLGDRLAAAIAARFAGTALACRCGLDDCDAGDPKDKPAKDMTVYVITDATTGQCEGATDLPDHPDGSPAPGRDDPQPCSTDDDEPTVEDSHADSEAVEGEDADGEPDAPAPTLDPATLDTISEPHVGGTPGFVFGSGIVPNPLLGRLLAGARFREIRHPGQTGPESRYTPSRALADFVRCRDLTCRFPGCDHPATTADIDHTVPYPVGPTHASNLKILCRFHHLLKTFWIGATGWQDRQYPDGTVDWTSPTGHTWTTYPGSRLLFPVLCHPTATLWTGDPPVVDTSDTRTVAVPRRRRTRAQNRARNIAAERRLNDDLVAERNKPPPF